MVARLLSVSDDTELSDLHDVFQQVLGWSGDLGYSFRIHGKEFNSFRGRPRSKPLREFRLHRQEKFLYICDLLDMWEWEVRVMDIQEGGDRRPRSPLPWRSWRCAPGELRWAPWLLADAQTSAAGSDRQRSGVSGSNDSVAFRYASRAASQHLEFAPGLPFVRGGKTSIGDSSSTGRWNQVASVCKKPTSDWQGPPAGGSGYEVPSAGDLCLRSRRTP